MSPTTDTPPPATSAPSETRPFQFTLRTLLIWVAVFSLFCGLLACAWHAWERARLREDNMPCMMNLKGIALALHAYHDTYGCFPPAHLCDEHATPMHSWRVLILPYLEGQALHDQYDFSEPWNGPNNSRLAAMPLQNLDIPDIYQCPRAGTAGTPLTNYVAVTGPDTMWLGSESRKREDVSSKDTILVIEIANSDIHWMEPRDLSFKQALAGLQAEPNLAIGSKHPNGILYVTADGRVAVLDRDIDAESLRKLMTAEEANAIHFRRKHE